MSLDDAPAPTCTVCRRALYADELNHQACRPCTERVDDNLAALAGPVTFTGHGRERKLVSGLYAALSRSLTPGAGGGGPAVSGSRTAPLPLRLEPLSLIARGGVVTILQTWIVDWHELLDYRHPRWEGNLQQQCDQAVKRLRVLLPWAAEAHPAFAEFAGELAQIKRQCEAQVSGERPPRRVHVECPCGQTLGFTLDTTGLRCPNCQQQYGHSELLDLPLAERRAAA